MFWLIQGWNHDCLEATPDLEFVGEKELKPTVEEVSSVALRETFMDPKDNFSWEILELPIYKIKENKND